MDVDRIGARHVRRQHAGQRLLRRGRELGQHDAAVGGAIGGKRSRSVAIGDDRKPIAARNPVHREDPRRGEQLGIRLDAHRAGAPHRRVEDRIRRRRIDGTMLHRPAGVQHDDGLRPGRRTQRRQEASRVADAFGVQQDAVGSRIGDQRIQPFTEPDVDRAPQRNHGGEADARRPGEIEHRRADRAGLRDEREPAAAGDRAAERRIEPDSSANHAERMGTEHPNAARGRAGHELVAPAPRVGVLQRWRREDDRRLDAGARGVSEHVGHRVRRRDDQRKVDRLRNGGERRVRAPREYSTVAGIDNVERAVVAAAEQIFENDAAVRSRLARRADERDRRRREKRA